MPIRWPPTCAVQRRHARAAADAARGRRRAVRPDRAVYFAVLRPDGSPAGRPRRAAAPRRPTTARATASPTSTTSGRDAARGGAAPGRSRRRTQWSWRRPRGRAARCWSSAAAVLAAAAARRCCCCWLSGCGAPSAASCSRWSRWSARSTRATRSDLTPVPVARDARATWSAWATRSTRCSRASTHGVRAQREFAGNVAHELRTPLAGIRALAEYGLAQKDPAVWREQLAAHRAAARQRASHLVDQLLALALADEAAHGLQRGRCALDALVATAVLRAAAARRRGGGGPGRARPRRSRSTVLGHRGADRRHPGQPDRQRAALRPAGRPAPTPRVTVELQRRGRRAAADGDRQRPRHRRRAVQPRDDAALEQGATARRSWDDSGAGLGLAIVARYVALLGGRLLLGAAPDGPGLRASVWLRRPPTA